MHVQSFKSQVTKLNAPVYFGSLSLQVVSLVTASHLNTCFWLTKCDCTQKMSVLYESK